MKLSRTLGVRDIVLMNVTAIIGLRWISLAAASGNTSIILWLFALVFFFLPQAFAVIELTKRYPDEGGIYVWTKESFGNFHGFISGWCYWTNNLVYFPNLMVYIAGIAVYIIGGRYLEMGENKLYVLLFSLTAIWIVTFFNYIGLKTGKWLNNIGGLGTWLTGLVLIIFSFIALVKFGLANPMPPGSFVNGLMNFDNFTFWAAMCFGFTGLELASVLAGEVKDPQRSIPKAAIISGVVVACIYILGTAALLISLPKSEINIISGFLQGIAAVGERIGLGWTTGLLALLITLGGIGGLMAWFTGAARIPFVAGIDKYLPRSFGKTHPKYGTPHIAILIQALIASALIIMSFTGSTVEEAYLILLDTTILVYFIPYLYMFSAYFILGKSSKRADQPDRKRTFHNPLSQILAVSGFLTTLIAMITTLIPPEESGNAVLYEIKVIGGFMLFFVTGGVIYYTKTKK
ncbi:APC family permease [candidate division KSB1 bacterium]